MLRFLGISWNSDNSDAFAAAKVIEARLMEVAEWHTAFAQQSCRVFFSGAQPTTGKVYKLANGAGVILGTLFHRKHQAYGSGEFVDDTIIDPALSSIILATRGRRLLDSYWGDYVAFLRDSAKGTTYVSRGPMSSLKCFQSEFRGVNVFFSHVEDCESLKLLRFSINWDFIRAYVAAGDPATQETAINEIRSLESGECVELSNGCVLSHLHWNPGEIAKSIAIESPLEAVNVLRQVTQACTSAWASRHNSLLHRLSGGLDSSIVLGCLARVPSRPRITCVNYHSSGAVGDERKFARAVAQHLNCELLERPRNRELNLEIFRTIRRTARPILAFSACDSYRGEIQLAATREATAITCGELGDSVFEHAVGRSAAAEYLWRHGLRPAFVRVARDVSRLRQESLWKVARLAVRDGLMSPPRSHWSYYLHEIRADNRIMADTRLISADALREFEQSITRFIHPWLADVDGIPPGKLVMIASLPMWSYHEEPFSGMQDPNVIAPLSSQPVIEVCLRIATYLNVRDGWDRAIARRAFAEDLPELVRRRTTKGTPQLWIREVVERNAKFLQRFLLEGLLVEKNILDKEKIAAMLGTAPTKSGVLVSEIVEQLYVEAWLRRWTEGEYRAAA